MLVAAKSSFFVRGNRLVRAGEIFDDRHGLVRAHPSMFAPVDYHGIEEATSTPGQKRAVQRAKPAAEPEDD